MWNLTYRNTEGFLCIRATSSYALSLAFELLPAMNYLFKSLNILYLQTLIRLILTQMLIFNVFLSKHFTSYFFCFGLSKLDPSNDFFPFNTKANKIWPHQDISFFQYFRKSFPCFSLLLLFKLLKVGHGTHAFFGTHGRCSWFRKHF